MTYTYDELNFMFDEIHAKMMKSIHSHSHFHVNDEHGKSVIIHDKVLKILKKEMSRQQLMSDIRPFNVS